jgi:signal transduction histidine kinase
MTILNNNYKINLIYVRILSILILILSNSLLYSQIYEVHITDISVGTVVVPSDKYGDIVISAQDTIIFSYELDITLAKTKKPFLYKVVIKCNGDESPQTLGLKQIKYVNLREGDYSVEVSAFDLKGDWTSLPEIINFRVNNQEAIFRQKLSEFETDIKNKDSIITMLKADNEAANTFEITLRIIIAVTGVLTIVFVILFLLFRKKYENQKKSSDDNNKLTKKYLEELNELKTQTSKISETNAEVESLKMKIDAISKKIESITALNSDFTNDMKSVQSKTSQLTSLQASKNGIFSDILKGISNPTNAIKGLVELLRNYDFNAMETRDVVTNIIDTTKKIIGLSEDIQRLAEFEFEDVSLNFDSVNIEDIVNNAIEKNIDDAHKKNIEIKVNISSDLKPIRLDYQKIIVVLHNLINNAIKFTNPKGKITINCYLKNNNAYFEVADTGIGIDQEGLQKIYENMAAENYTWGMGDNDTIGLLTVKKYVEAHNGKVMVSSMLNKGSTFSFNIPYNL